MPGDPDLTAPRSSSRHRSRLAGGAVVAGLLVLCVGGGVGLASLATESPNEQPTGTPDATPRPGTKRVDASAQGAEGSPALGTLLYENTGGRTCMVIGEVGNGTVGRHFPGGFQEKPLRDTGDCLVTPNPVAARISWRPEQSLTIVFGLVNHDVADLAVSGPHGKQALEPGDGGSFIATFDEVVEQALTIEATLKDGSVREVRLPPTPDFERLNQAARNGGLSGH